MTVALYRLRVSCYQKKRYVSLLNVFELNVSVLQDACDDASPHSTPTHKRRKCENSSTSKHKTRSIYTCVDIIRPIDTQQEEQV